MQNPRYGPHESQVIMALVHAMVANNIVKKCSSAWVALVVLAPKANQEAIPWHEYIWRLLRVSYRRLNRVTCPYAYPMPQCDDAVDEIPPGMMFFVSFDLATGYLESSLQPPHNTNWLSTRPTASTLSNVCQWVPSTQPPFL
jgi:hypothetical protein